MDGAFGGTLGETFVAAFAGGGFDGTTTGAAGGAADAASGAGAGIDGNFGGAGTGGKAFVAGAGGGTGGGIALAGRGGAGAAPALDKPVNGRGATVGGRADGATFAPGGDGTLLPAAGSTAGGFGGAGGSLGGMKRVLPRRIKRQSHCSSTRTVREEF